MTMTPTLNPLVLLAIPLAPLVGSAIAGLFGTIEELSPFTDVIPTFTITWFYTYVLKKE